MSWPRRRRSSAPCSTWPGVGPATSRRVRRARQGPAGLRLRPDGSRPQAPQRVRRRPGRLWQGHRDRPGTLGPAAEEPRIQVPPGPRGDRLGNLRARSAEIRRGPPIVRAGRATLLGAGRGRSRGPRDPGLARPHAVPVRKARARRESLRAGRRRLPQGPRPPPAARPRKGSSRGGPPSRFAISRHSRARSPTARPLPASSRTPPLPSTRRFPASRSGCSGSAPGDRRTRAVPPN